MELLDCQPLHRLPAFDWQRPHAHAALAEYARYYGLDFSNDMPDVQHCAGSHTLAGQSLAVQLFRRPGHKNTALVLHGYMDHVGLFAHLIRFLLANGYNVLTLDLPGHGLSFEGERAGIDDFQQYQAVVSALIAEAHQQLAGGQWLLVGQSTGGAIAMDYVLNHAQQPFDRLVLLAPLVIPVQWRWVQAQLFFVRWFRGGVKRVFKNNSGDAAFLDFVHNRDPLQPRAIRTSWVAALHRWQRHFHRSPPSAIDTLLIQGEQDIIVDWRYNLAQIEKKFTRLRIIRMAEANHHLVNETLALRNEIFAEMASFIRQDLSR